MPDVEAVERPEKHTPREFKTEDRIPKREPRRRPPSLNRIHTLTPPSTSWGAWPRPLAAHRTRKRVPQRSWRHCACRTEDLSTLPRNSNARPCGAATFRPAEQTTFRPPEMDPGTLLCNFPQLPIGLLPLCLNVRFQTARCHVHLAAPPVADPTRRALRTFTGALESI